MEGNQTRFKECSDSDISFFSEFWTVKYEPKSAEFSSFLSKGRYESKFTGQLVKFRPITVETKLVKPIKFAFASSRQLSAHSPSDHQITTGFFTMFTRGLIA